MRPMTEKEQRILREVQLFWGPENRSAEVFIAGADEAVLSVTSKNGVRNVMATNLTNLADWLEDGTLSKRHKRRWVMGPLGDGISSARCVLRYWHYRLLGGASVPS